MATPNRSVMEISNIVDRHKLAEQISQKYNSAQMARQSWLDQKQELRNYLFATDTSTTSNSDLPWKNKTTLPKLTQIRDNLHANYMSALFPNDDWFLWEGHTEDAALAGKRETITAYIKNKLDQSGFYRTVSQLLYDFIDYGNVFHDAVYVSEFHVDEETGERIPGYIGPKAVRISPMDIVFNPTAAEFASSWKVTRAVKEVGAVLEEAELHPEMGFYADILDKMKGIRNGTFGLDPADFNKLESLQVDGFGSFSEYLESGYVELLEFEGTIYDTHSGELHRNELITVVDRCYVLRRQKFPSWLGRSLKGHTGWRTRPDNLYAMGPLDNLVGMQYRIDHLENLKADAMDLAVLPPLFVTGNVEDFTYAPGEEIYGSEGATLVELGKHTAGVIGAANEIGALQQQMEEMAGAPKQAMGIRTPGEKTKFEVQTLEMAASRIFQNKLRHFEQNCLEDLLNSFLELARRNLDGADLIRVLDDDAAVADFLSVTKQDITASGKLRATGARHFAAQATLVQNLMGFLTSPAYQDPAVRAHISGKRMAKLVEQVLGLTKFDLYEENVQVMESAETTGLVHEAQDQVAATDSTPIEPPDDGTEEEQV